MIDGVNRYGRGRCDEFDRLDRTLVNEYEKSVVSKMTNDTDEGHSNMLSEMFKVIVNYKVLAIKY